MQMQERKSAGGEEHYTLKAGGVEVNLYHARGERMAGKVPRAQYGAFF